MRHFRQMVPRNPIALRNLLNPRRPDWKSAAVAFAFLGVLLLLLVITLAVAAIAQPPRTVWIVLAAILVVAVYR